MARLDLAGRGTHLKIDTDHLWGMESDLTDMTAAKAQGKWIDGFGAETPLSEAARIVLDIRLRAVERMLPLAARRAADDLEYVHQLRVATRRSAAALQIFRSSLPPKEHRKVARSLKRLRRAAGLARECDVQKLILEAERGTVDPPVARSLDGVLRGIEKERRRAQKTIRKMARRYPVASLKKRRKRLVRAIDSRPAMLRDAARDTMPALIEALRQVASTDLTVLDNLHTMRITGKRLRYAMEVFAPCFDDDFRDTYGRVESLQEQLGDVNDCHELLLRVDRWAVNAPKRESSDPRAAQDYYRNRLNACVDAFLHDWTSGARDRLFETLARLSPDGERRPRAGAVVEIEAAPTDAPTSSAGDAG